MEIAAGIDTPLLSIIIFGNKNTTKFITKKKCYSHFKILVSFLSQHKLCFPKYHSYMLLIYILHIHILQNRAIGTFYTFCTKLDILLILKFNAQGDKLILYKFVTNLWLFSIKLFIFKHIQSIFADTSTVLCFHILYS